MSIKKQKAKKRVRMPYNTEEMKSLMKLLISKPDVTVEEASEVVNKVSTVERSILSIRNLRKKLCRLAENEGKTLPNFKRQSTAISLKLGDILTGKQVEKLANAQEIE